MRKPIIFISLAFLTLLVAVAPRLRAESAPDLKKETGPDAKAMRTEYDKISAIKMKKYDGLMVEIQALRDRVGELLTKEQKLTEDKKQAEVRFSEGVKAATIAEDKVKKVLAEASAAEEKMRRFADDSAKESVTRRDKIEKLKETLKEFSDKMEEQQSSKEKASAKNAALETEYKAASDRWMGLKEKSASRETAVAGEEDPAKLKKLVRELEAKVQDAERLKQKLSEEILASAEKIQAVEEEISSLENEDAAQAKMLREKIEDFGKAKKEDRSRDQAIEGLKKAAGESAAKLQSEKEALKKITEDLGKVSIEKVAAEKELIEKIDELKVRVSVLVVQNEADEALLPKEVELSPKDMKIKLKTAEKEVRELKRKTEQTLWANETMKQKLDKEMLEKHFDLAIIYERNGLYKDAEREYLECLTIAPEDADVHYNLAVLYDDRLNDNKKAERHYYKYLTFRPIGESGERVRDWVMRSELEKRLGSGVR